MRRQTGPERLAYSLVMRFAVAVLIAGGVFAQPSPLTVEAPPRELPAHVAAKLSAADRALFGRLMRVGLEAAWSAVTQEGYPLCFINELTPLHTDRRMVGRARTARYLPNRKDLREKIYAAGPQLNYRTAEESQPGDVLVFDAGGERNSTVSGAMVTTRFLVRGGAGVLVDGCMRDLPDLAAMPANFYLRCGHASSVSPLMMSVDYQVPVRIGGVTIVPGDLLVGERHGVLVIPAAIVDKVLEKAMAHDEQEEFQRTLLLRGEPIYGVYPTLNDANRKKFEEWRKTKK